MSIERRTSVVDRLFTGHINRKGAPPIQRVNQFVLEGEGDLVLKDWQNAVVGAVAAYPAIRLICKGHLGFTRWVNEGPLPHVELIENHHWNGISSEGAPFAQRTLSLREGPCAEIILLPGSPARVVFRTHHALMDGMGMLIFIEAVFQALRGEEITGNNTSVSIKELNNQKLRCSISINGRKSTVQSAKISCVLF